MEAERSVQVVVHVVDRDTEADPLLRLESGDRFGYFGRIVGVVAPRHASDVGLGRSLVEGRRRSGRQADPAIAVGAVRDGDGDPRVTEQVRGPATADTAVDDDRVIV